MLYFLKIRLYLHTETDYLTKETVLIQLFYENKKSNQFKPKKNGFRKLKKLYFLKIRLYLPTETDYLTKETVLIQLFYENKK